MAQAQALYAAPIQYDPAVENRTNYVERLEAYFDASRSLKQNEGESVADYLAELRRIADHCGFGDALDNNLRDRFVIGRCEKTVQRILLAKPKKLTLKEALDTALAAELAMRNADRLPGSSSLRTTAGDVNALRFKKHKGRQQETSRTKTAQPCICCGDSSHDQPNCPHKKTTCFTCNKQGDLASRCFRTQSTPAVNRKKQQANLLTEEAQLGQAEEAFHLFTVHTPKATVDSVNEVLQWGTVEVTMQVDTGSPVCMISRDTYSKNDKVWPPLQETIKELHCYLGKLPVLGVLAMPVRYGNKQVQGQLYIVDCTGLSLCGRDVI
ncbi:uncharacterized protein LOC120847426 [Ixodes scapularis]|uniref:uncharacterized protein LOC120847426 n=1 Tax=Ixodes scapularis TaxID=6945 RepID=UPI001A9DB3C2|nr:uncharacterized protein LOC120847426 [Ixodes scapularis]